MITNFKIFEFTADRKDNPWTPLKKDSSKLNSFFHGEVWVIFDSNSGYIRSVADELNRKTWQANKQKVLDMLKDYFDIDQDLEEYAMVDSAWGWCIYFYKSGINFSIVTTPGWHIDENRDQISAKELLEIGLENLESYITAKKYNL